ncbi:hypothetical protein BDQ17DRAFT_1540527 [Cyathus striatus]|nr:hypothetical protein BDQ17DRAFT_1540527 [Cyathus striatus]
MAPLSICFLGSERLFRKRLPPHIWVDIANHANGWSSLTSDGDALSYVLRQSSMEESIKSKERGLAQLRRLTLYMGWRSSCDYGIFQGATALEEVELIQSMTIPETLELHWASVKRLTLNDCKISQPPEDDDNISAFRTMSSLEELAWLKVYVARRAIPEDFGLIILPALHTLTIQAVDDFDDEGIRRPVTGIWPTFRMPSLTKLRFVEDIAREFEIFMLMIRDSACVIKKLQLEKYSYEFFVQAINEFDGLEELCLIDSLENSCKIITLLLCYDYNPASVNFLPCLRKLEFRDTSLEDGEIITTLMDIMRSRSSTTSTEMSRQQLSNAMLPLLSVKCVVGISASGYDSSIAELKRLGDELGIRVELIVKN